MGLRAVLPSITVLAASLAVLGQTAKTADEPRYDPATVVDEMGTVADIREVPRDSPLNGVHLSVNLDTQTIDSYLGPSAFLKEISCTITKGGRVQIIGSKVRFNGGYVVLVREVREDNSTWYLRDRQGNPYWPPTDRRKT
ncbi:exported hypothetical protein [Candidatus Sulfopaludibacter sp. SbA4]|nr:exported hypothetical protein [Candidatus Sulfopaludibacter sp. SbA4]